MANATVLPTYTQNKFFKWSTTLTSSLSISETAIAWSDAPRDEAGAIITGAFLITVKNTRSNPNRSETMWVPASAVAADGLSATGVVRRVKLSGIDYTASDSDSSHSYEFKAGDEVFCSIAPQDGELLRSSIQGLIGTGTNSLKVGDGADSDVKYYAYNADSNKPWIGYDHTTNQWLISNDGTSSFVPGTGAGAITGGDGITVTAGDIDVDVTDTTIFKQTTAGVADAGKIPRLNGSGVLDLGLLGTDANITIANLNTLVDGPSSNADALHTHDGFSRNAINFTAGEDLLAGDTLDVTGTDTVKRHAPTLPTDTVATTTQASNIGTGPSRPQVVRVVKLSDSLFATSTLGVYIATSGVHRLHRLPVTASTGVTGSPTVASATVGTGTSGTRTDMVKAGTDKVFTVASKASGVYALVADLSSGITLGTEVTVDTSNCDFACVDYISDSHCLVIYNDTSANNIAFAKYTLSGTTLSSSTNSTVAAPTGTFTFEGARRFAGTDYFLLVIQSTTDGTAKCAIATYDETLSSFTAVGSWVNFPSNADIYQTTSGGGVAFVQVSDAKMFISFPTSTTTIGTMLVTRTGTTPSYSSIIATTIDTQSGFALAPVNDRCVLQTSLASTTVTTKLIEITASGDITTRASNTSFTSKANTFAAMLHINSMTMGVLKILTDGSDDTSWGYGLYTYNPFVGVASANAGNGDSITVISQGYTTAVSGLTPATKYCADLAGLTTTSSVGSPEKVGVSKDTSEIIIKSW